MLLWGGGLGLEDKFIFSKKGADSGRKNPEVETIGFDGTIGRGGAECVTGEGLLRGGNLVCGRVSKDS